MVVEAVTEAEAEVMEDTVVVAVEEEATGNFKGFFMTHFFRFLYNRVFVILSVQVLALLGSFLFGFSFP